MAGRERMEAFCGHFEDLSRPGSDHGSPLRLSPRGDRFEVPRELQNTFVFSRTDELGVYGVREGSGNKVTQQFAVNLFDKTAQANARMNQTFCDRFARLACAENVQLESEAKAFRQQSRKPLAAKSATTSSSRSHQKLA